ncbi:hypothetical protein AB0J21_31130 [Streptomyces sp. NPDC049954]|uniref:hypothetical protein n=1 Tax=Streptomyces sp. NPDC049954 TaxID=3155779 RepID=UPI00342B9649
MTTRRARRTARSAALVAVAAAATFSLTACQTGGDDDAAASSTRISGSVSQSGGTDDASDHASGDAEPGTDKAQNSARAETSAARTTTAPAATTKAASPVRTETLVDGSKAEISQLGEQRYRAKIVNAGAVLATMETNGHDAGLDGNGMFVVLTMGGEIHSWMGGEHTGPGTFKLAGGWTAKVTKLGELRFRAQIIGREGAVEATLETNGHDVGLDANASYIVLSAGGEISSHM